MRRAAAREPLHRPAAFVGDGLQLEVRVERARLADAFEQFDIVVAVRVEEAVIEIETVVRGEFLRRQHLAVAEAQGPDNLAGAEIGQASYRARVCQYV